MVRADRILPRQTARTPRTVQDARDALGAAVARRRLAAVTESPASFASYGNGQDGLIR